MSEVSDKQDLTAMWVSHFLPVISPQQGAFTFCARDTGVSDSEEIRRECA